MTKSFQETSSLAFLDPNTTWKMPDHSLRRGFPGAGSGIIPLKRAKRQPEFSRHYQPGDPIKALDWRAFAKHEDLLVREQREYSQIKHLVVLDIAETMNWGPSLIGAQDWITKSNISLRIIVHLFLKLIREGNQVYLSLCDSSKQNDLSRLNSFSLSQIDCQNLFRDAALDPKPASQLKEIQKRKKPFLSCEHNWTKVTFISDMINQHTDPTPQLSSLKSLTSSVHVFHLLCAKETDWSWTNTDHYYSEHQLKGLSKYRGKALKHNKQLQEIIQTWKEDIAKKCKHYSIEYFYLSDETPIEEYLSMIGAIYAV